VWLSKMSAGPKTMAQELLEFKYGHDYRRRLGVKEANAFANAF